MSRTICYTSRMWKFWGVRIRVILCENFNSSGYLCIVKKKGYLCDFFLFFRVPIYVKVLILHTPICFGVWILALKCYTTVLHLCIRLNLDRLFQFYQRQLFLIHVKYVLQKIRCFFENWKYKKLTFFHIHFYIE